MSTEVSTLVGVVVGAVLGGGGQVLVGVLDRRNKVARWELEHQRDAYVRWVQYLHVLFVHLENDPAGTAGAPTPEGRTVAAIESDEGPRALGELRLVAPDDTYRAAERSRGAVLAMAGVSKSAADPGSPSAGGETPWDTQARLFREARDEFINLARRDIGTLRRPPRL
jgi:hypothetical protein